MTLPKIGIALAGTVLMSTAASSAPAPSGEDKLAGLVKGRTAGAPVDCVVRLRGTEPSENIPGVGFVYGQGRTLYLNRFVNGCPALTSTSAVATRTPSVRLCRGDIARIVDPVNGIERGSCVLDRFTPYERAKR